MKRLTSFILAMVLALLALSACGGSPDETASGTTVSETTNGAGPYDVTFSVGGTETKVTVEAGETPVYPGEASWETSEHYYKITGWEPEIAPASGDVTYTAVLGEYGLTLYNVRFVMPDGVYTVPTHEGEVPTPPDGYDETIYTVERIRTFVGWNNELTAVTAQNWEANGKKMIYSPVYSDAIRTYRITFVLEGTEYPVDVNARAIPECPVNPIPDVLDANGNACSFFGWDKEVKPATEDAVYTAWYGNAGEVSVLTAKDGASGVLTMTYDDGIYDTAKWVNKENKKYGLNGSCMLIAGRSTLTDNLDKWNELFAMGTLEPQSHTMTHDVLPADWSSHYPDNKGNNNQAKYKYELIDSKAMLERLFPGHDIICLAPGNNTLSTASFALNDVGEVDLSRPLEDGGAQKVANTTYFAVRQGRYGMQSLNPACTDEEGGWYNLKIQWFRRWSGLDEGKGWLDSAVNDGTWLIVMCHAIEGDGASSSGNIDITTDLADQFFAYASKYVKSGKLWCATLGDATKYIRERQGATVEKRIYGDSISIGLKLNRTTPDGKTLSEEVFDYPLSVEVRVPDDWSSATVAVGGETLTVTPYVRSENGARVKYVTVNVVPGGDGAVASVTVSRAE